jgi:hypothetical protein
MSYSLDHTVMEPTPEKPNSGKLLVTKQVACLGNTNACKSGHNETGKNKPGRLFISLIRKTGINLASFETSRKDGSYFVLWPVRP